MDRRSIPIIECLECPDRPDTAHIEFIGKPNRFSLNFSDQTLNKTVPIDPLTPLPIQSPRRSPKIKRCRNRCRTDYRWMRAGFAQIFQDQIPSKTEPD